jgi:hypothetical protein
MRLSGICEERFILSIHSSPSEGFTESLREILLQDSSDLFDEEPLIAEMAAQLCFELAYGTPSPWRVFGYVVLDAIYRTPYGSQSLQNLGQNGHVIDDVAAAVFTK